MNKKTAIASALVGILLIGIVTAGLIDYFGRITGSVEVKAPVFYLDGHWGGAYYDLFVNEIPGDELEIYLSDGNRLLFVTEPLGIEYFYETNFNIKVWIKTNNQSNIAQYRIVRIKEDLSLSTICEPEKVVTFDGNYWKFWKKELSCSSNGEISLEPEDRIGLEISGAGLDSEYWISTGKDYTDGYSRIEVTAI